MDYSMQIKEYRKKSNLTQREIAKMLNISQPHYNDLENGKNFPNGKMILKLCDVFKCTPNDLFGIKGVHRVVMDSLDD